MLLAYTEEILLLVLTAILRKWLFLKGIIKKLSRSNPVLLQSWCIVWGIIKKAFQGANWFCLCGFQSAKKMEARKQWFSTPARIILAKNIIPPLQFFDLWRTY